MVQATALLGSKNATLYVSFRNFTDPEFAAYVLPTLPAGTNFTLSEVHDMPDSLHEGAIVESPGQNESVRVYVGASEYAGCAN